MKDIRPQNINKYEEKREVVNTFRELVTAVERISGKRVCLNEPATLHEINQVEQIVGHQFPEDVRKIYLLANGQREEDVNKIYLPAHWEEAECVPLFEDGYPLMSLAYTFMPLERVKEEWLSMKEVMDEDPDCGELYNIQGAVKGYHRTPNWVPIGDLRTCDYICIDFEPSDIGNVGQIISYIHDDYPIRRNHLGLNFNSYLGYIKKRIENGDIIYEE